MIFQKQLLVILSMLIILTVADYSVAQDRDYPPSHPPVERTDVLTVQPVMDRPPAHPPQVNKNQNDQSFENAPADPPPPPPPVEKPKPVFGGPVNDKRPDPPTTKRIPNGEILGIKKVTTNISAPVGIKKEVEQIDTTKRQGAALKDAMPMGTISASPEKSVGPKKVTVKMKISSPGRKLGKGQLRPVYKPLTERSLKKGNVTSQRNIPTMTISESKPTPTPMPPLDQYPAWINDLIAEEESEPVANPPASLWECIYKNQIVYYLPPLCCDIASVLYNEQGEVICAPDEGLTGSGDGRCPDFFEERKDCKIIWEDTRSSH